LDEASVEAGDGTCTTTGSPHPEIVVVTFTPSASVEVSAIGKFASVEMVSVFDNFGVVLVAALVHFRR
jgi:hypothetical protein